MPLSPEALERLNAHLDQRDNDLSQSLARAKRVDPSRERQVQPLAQQTGLPRDVVDRNLEETRTRVQFDPLEGMEIDSPGTATFMSEYENAAASSDNVEVMRSLEEKLKPRSGFWANTGRNVIERTNALVGNLIEAGGVASEGLENFMRDTVGIPNPGIVMGEDGMSWSWDVDTAETPNLMREVGAVASEQGRSGYQPTFTWENFKGDMTAQNLAGYVVETGSASLVDMAATITTLPAYIASRSQEMAEETAQLEGRDVDTVDVGDQLTALPTAVTVSLIEQYSARGALGFLSDGTSGPAKEIGKAFVREAGTEFVQEQVEYLGTTIPAEGQQVSLMDMLDRGLAGAVAGGPTGGALRGASLGVEALVTRTEKDLTQQLDSRFEQQSVDEIISDVQRDVLHQESPEKFRELVENIGPNERIYLSPEAVADAVNEGERLPDYLVNQMDGAEDIALTLDQFAMDIVANDTLLQRFRPHMKRKPGSLTQAELEASQGTAVRSLIEKASREQETLSEAEAIHREVSEQLVATGRLSQRSAGISAELIPAWVTTKVSELRDRGIETSPREVFDKLGLRVERGVAPERGRVMEQAGDVRPPAENLQDVIDSNFTMGRSLGQRTVPVDTLTTRMSEATDDAAAVDQLVEQMQSDEGFIESIIVDTEGNVIEGQHRAEAYRRMGRTEIPAVVIQDMGAAVDAVTATGVRPEQARQVVDEVAAIMGRGDNVSEYDTGGFDAQYQAAEQALSQQGESRVLNQPAFHGTPHTFDRFSLEAMGTGEGNQAFGWGLYFAQNREVAEYYRDALSSPELSDLYDQRGSLRFNRQPVPPEMDARIEELEAQEAAGNLYEVDVPEDSDLMIWDEPFANQPEKVKAAFEERREQIEDMLEDNGYSGELDAYTGKELYQITARLGEQDLLPPLDEEYERALEPNERASKYLNTLGIPGLRYLDGTSRASGEGNYNYVIWDDSAVSVRAVNDQQRQADVLLQGDERGSIELMDDERIIRLADTSDLSTFLHETAHLLLEGERIMATEYGLSENQEAILKMLDVDSFDNLTTEKHELFARTFEDYLRTGKAPSQRLKDAFAAFSRWLARIYQGIKQLGMNLDEETTAVLDRMLATQTEIEAVLEDPAYAQYFRSAEQAGMSDAEWAAYQKRVAKRRNRSESKLLDRVMSSYRRKRTREWNEERDILAAEEKVRLSETRAFQMQTFVKKNKLDYDAVAAAREDGQVLGRLLGASQKGGVDPELIAEQFGYDTTQDMLQELQETPTLDQAAEQAAEQKMVRKYGDVLNDGRLEQEVHDAVHNEVEAQRLLDELKVLNRRTRQPAVNLKAIRAEAEYAVESMTLAELDPFRYYRAEVRAARNAESARNAREARDFKMQQLANHYLYRAASQTMKDAQKWRPHLKALKTRNYRASQVDPLYANRLRQIGRMYDARVKPAKRKERALDLMQWLDGQITAGMPVEIHDPVLAEAYVRYKENGDIGDYRIPHIDQLTVEQLRGAYEMSRHLRYVGGKMAEAQSGEMKAKAESLAANIAANKGRKVQDEVKSGQRIRRELSHAVNLMPSLRNLVRNLDADWDNEGGQAFDLIYQEVARGTNNKLATHDQFVEDFTRIMDGWDKAGLDEKRSTERTVVREDGSKFTLSARGRFMLASYWGIESSREAIRQGHNVTDAEVTEMLSHMTTEQLEYVNKLWQFNETMAAPLFKAAAQQSGVAPKKLPPAPFMVNGVQMTGGHMRLFYDGVEPMTLSDETPLTAMNTVVPSKSGSAIERVGSGGRMVDLNTANIFRSLEENAHYIGFAEPAMRLQSILNNKAVRSAIADTRGTGFYRSLMQNVRGLTTNRPERDAIPMFTRLTNRVRKAKSAMYIMYNIKNIIQQPGTIPQVLDELGPGGYTKAVVNFYGNPQGMMEKVKFIRANSAQMNNRRAAMTREAAEIMRDVVNTDPGNRAWAMFKRHGLTPQTIIDLTIAYPLWMARYEQRMEAHGDHTKAVTEADVSVAESIGSGLDIHMGSIFQSNRGAWIKLLTLFGSWANSTMFQRMYRDSQGGTNFKTARALNGVVVVPMLTTLMSAALVADWPEEEGEEGFLPWLAKRHGGSMLGLIPVIGDIASNLAGFQPSTATQDAMSLPADIWQTGQQAVRGEATATETTEDTIRALGTFMILPGAGNVTRVLQSVNEYEEMEDPGDALRAVLEGSEKNE